MKEKKQKGGRCRTFRKWRECEIRISSFL